MTVFGCLKSLKERIAIRQILKDTSDIGMIFKSLYWTSSKRFLEPISILFSQQSHRHHCGWLPSKHWAISGSSVISFDSAVAHGLSFAHSLAGHFKGGSLIGGHALAVGAQVWLDLLPHLLLGVQLFVRLTCNTLNTLETCPLWYHTDATPSNQQSCFLNLSGQVLSLHNLL